MPFASARAGNVIGGGDWAPARLVPDVMRAALSGEPVAVRSPHAVRPWQHVLCPLSGYLLLAQALWEDAGFADGWNFGPAEEDARPVSWIVQRLAELWPSGFPIVADQAAGPHEARVLKLDSSRARLRLGWHPVWGLGEGLERSVAWYVAFGERADLRAVTESQIEEFTRARP
jgi:CDP-glucose 4,6-dehydratase